MPAEAPATSDAEPFERRLATILMADIVGYSRLMEANEERTLRVFRGHREIFDALLAQHRGRIFNTAGDAVLAEFPSAVEAVRCATEIQSALATRNDHLAADERMQFRIGINLGDVIVQGTDLLGDGVNVAARIQTAAPPGGVCVAGSVYDQIRNKLSLDFHPMGERTFKNISQPVRVFSIGEGADPSAAKASGASPPTAVAAAIPPAPGASRPIAAIAAGVIALAIAAGGAWWYLQDREAKAVEAARSAEAARAAERIRVVEDARRKAEEDANAKVVAEREARMKAELEAAQREAAEAKKRADATRVASATPGPRMPVVAPAAKDAPVPSAPASLPGAPPKEPEVAAAAATPGAAASPAGAASASYPNDGVYRGRACWELPGSGKAPACWNLDLAVTQNRIDSRWIGSYGGGKPSTIRGQLTSSGHVNALFEGFAVRGNAVSGEVSGRVNEGRMTLSSTLPNRAVVTATATRIR